MIATPDMWDPNTWVFPKREYRVYGDDRASVWAIVDEVDYAWLVQWKWATKPSREGKKIYLYRTVTQRPTKHSLFMHVAIMERTGKKPPSEHHVVVDHRNGNSLDCRRENLRWATRSMNRRNLHGASGHELFE